MGLNHTLTGKNELYTERFGENVTKDSEQVVEGETEEEKQERMQVHQQNVLAWQHYIDKHVADTVYRALFRNTDVPSTRDFNPHHHRPPINRITVVKALVSLDVQTNDARDMAHLVTYPASTATVSAKVCRHSCNVCKQHELLDGKKIMGSMFIYIHTFAYTHEWYTIHACLSHTTTRVGFCLQNKQFP